MARPRSALAFSPAVAAILVLGACSAGGAPTGSASAAEVHASHLPSPQPSASAPTEDSPPADATRLEDGDTIVMAQFAFSETAVIVSAGATLTFMNEDNVGHTVTNGVQGFPVEDPAFNKPVQAGDSIEITFGQPGRYDVTCEPHPIMQMTVFVEG
ncbi:MAG TPA: plastocyanin/azurin family copper-binding protein [Candidatus Limnocylindria bacterium]|nr:plastocyanin/azurin family copper-binding protein [Candidatus Limnocylindria bacterium]